MVPDSEFTIDYWVSSFESFTQYVSYLGQLEPVNGTVAQRLRLDTVQVFNLLLGDKSVRHWNYFHITERAQRSSRIYSTVGQIAASLNLAQRETPPSDTADPSVVVFQTKRCHWSTPKEDVIEFVFPGELNITIPFEGRQSPRSDGQRQRVGSQVYATAVLIRNLHPYLSLDFPLNSHIFTVVIEDQRELRNTIRYV